ncbi:MAG: 3-hydroxyacyl-[acyl-carrier-protein] dehydratase [Planctomycetota bacterium]
MDCETSGPVVMDREQIKELIPHRDPFLFVDRVVELTDEAITTEWDVDPAAAFFQGHYPGDPIVPGVLLNEFVFQSAAVFMSKTLAGDLGAGAVPVLTRIEDARFKQIVRPGEVVRAVVTLTDRVGPACYMKAQITANGKKAVRLSFVVALTNPGGSQ